jgi:hypothetical protein
MEIIEYAYDNKQQGKYKNIQYILIQEIQCVYRQYDLEGSWATMFIFIGCCALLLLPAASVGL